MEGVTIPHSRHTTESQKVFYDGPLQDGPASDFTKKLMSEECKASTILWKSAPVFFGFLVPRTCSLFSLLCIFRMWDSNWPGEGFTRGLTNTARAVFQNEWYLGKSLALQAVNTTWRHYICPAIATWCSCLHKATQHLSCTWPPIFQISVAFQMGLKNTLICLCFGETAAVFVSWC